MKLLGLYEISETAGTTGPAFNRALVKRHNVTASGAFSILQLDGAFVGVDLI